LLHLCRRQPLVPRRTGGLGSELGRTPELERQGLAARHGPTRIATSAIAPTPGQHAQQPQPQSQALC
jgi:hypothetical protein